MMNQFQKAVNLARKTGDRIIVFDNNGNQGSVYVVMSLDEYEKLSVGQSEVRGLTEEELLDKINRDIAIWKSQLDYYGQDLQGIAEQQESIRQRVYNRLDRIDMPRYEEKRKWSIPEERKEAAEEIIEEDRQYLEEITF